MSSRSSQNEQLEFYSDISKPLQDDSRVRFVLHTIPLWVTQSHFSAGMWGINGRLHTFRAEDARGGTRMRALYLVWSAVWWNEGLFMAGNPFEGPGAHLDLALLAHGPRGQMCILRWLVWPSPCRRSEAEWRRTKESWCLIPCHSHRGRNCSASSPWWEELLLCFASAGWSVGQGSHSWKTSEMAAASQKSPTDAVLLKGNQGHGHACADKYCHDNTTRWHCGDILSKVLKRNRFIFLFSHPHLFSPLLSIPLPFTAYLQPLLTCLRVGRAGWLTGWLGVHGPRLWLE